MSQLYKMLLKGNLVQLPNVKREGTEAQRVHMTCQRSHCLPAAE